MTMICYLKLTPYNFRCGYVERQDNDTTGATVSISWEHCCYHVKGFDRNGQHHYETTRILRQARRLARHVML
jgi:hypothetical protein